MTNYNSFLQKLDDLLNGGTLRWISPPTFFDHTPQLIGQLGMSGTGGSLIRGDHSNDHSGIFTIVKGQSARENLSANSVALGCYLEIGTHFISQHAEGIHITGLGRLGLG